MKSVFRVEITPKLPLVPDICGRAILSEIKDFGINSVNKVEVIKVYQIDSAKNRLDQRKLKEALFLEPLWQKEAEKNLQSGNFKKVIEIALKPGVTNTELDSIISATKDLGFKIVKAQTNRKFILWGNPSRKELSIITDKLLMNKTIEEVQNGKSPFEKKIFSKPKVEKIKLRNLNDKDLLQLSEDRLLYLSLAELINIKHYFLKIGRDPTDCELETIAQTWSEHCFHKTFKSPIRINNILKPSFIERIKSVTKMINHKDCLVTFSDNAGIVSFDKNHAFCAKCETHNSPSALEPYGGAMTGSGGVFRDIAGAGLGAKNIASSDIFCFADPAMKLEDVPAGCLHPRRIMQKCIDGVRYYGNCMGIPTVNGSLSFDTDYRAKPVVLVGALGIIPKKHVFKKKVAVGDLIVSLGGKTGRDGIHGATFSSGEMTKDTENKAQHAVQIGNPIEEKKMFDALLCARDLGLIKNISDCGGGGYSSAIGEMGKEVGVKVDLNFVPLKYEGLNPWEIWLSESQERMVVVIEPENLIRFNEICKRFDTSLTVLGHFSGDKKLQLIFKNQIVADLSMDFLFNGLPKKILEGEYRKKPVIPSDSEESLSLSEKISRIRERSLHFGRDDIGLIFNKILSNLNVASKEEIVRRYDHEVQGKLALKPFLGAAFDGPQDGAVIKPLFESDSGLAFGHGLAISMSKIDPYWGAAAAVDEAVRNVVGLGADPDRIFLLDNFIFPKPTKTVLGSLDRAVDGLCDAAKNYGTPFISGKDSLSGTYKSPREVIEVPSTIIVTSVGIVPNIDRTVTSDFKSPGSLIYVLGSIPGQLGGSIYYHETGIKSAPIPQTDFKQNISVYKLLYQAVKKGLISSCHDVSEGGLAVTLAEMCFGGNLGVKITLDEVLVNSRLGLEAILFGESGGRFAVEVEKSQAGKFEKLFKDISFALVGQIVKDKIIRITYQKRLLIQENVFKLKSIWQRPFRQYF